MLSEVQRRMLDDDVLKAASKWGDRAPTYVIRNTLDWPGKPWHRKGLKTSDVLRACRRLKKAGLLEEAPSDYRVMKCWSPTEAGKRALAEAEGRE